MRCDVCWETKVVNIEEYESDASTVQHEMSEREDETISGDQKTAKGGIRVAMDG